MLYCPYAQLGKQPNIIVSGTATAHSSALISPFAEGTDGLRNLADTCTGIATLCLDSNRLDRALLTSTDRFSVDALTAIFTLVDQTKTVSNEVLQQIARTALYEHGPDRDIVRVVFILHSWMDPIRSPLNAQMFLLPHSEFSNVLLEELLPRLSRVIKKVDYLDRYWQAEDEQLELTELLLEEGAVKVRELDDLDLAIFNIDSCEFDKNGRLASDVKSWSSMLHPIGIHNRTSCSRILMQAGTRSHFYFRADSLTEANKSVVPARKDLKVFTERLNSLEHSTSRWTCDPLTVLKPSVSCSSEEESRVSAEQFLELVQDFLTN